MTTAILLNTALIAVILLALYLGNRIYHDQ